MRISGFSFCLFLFAGMVMLSGCTGSTPASERTPAPEGPGVTGIITPASPVSQPVVNASKYKVGDIIWKAPDIYNAVVEADMGVVILSADSADQKYTIDYIFRDTNTTTWYRVYPDPKVDPMSIDDELYPYTVGNINISTIVTKYPSKDAFDAHMKAPVPTTG